MSVPPIEEVAADQLRLPPCPLPRPGDTVFWFAGSRHVTGRLTGHNKAGEALIINDFGNGIPKKYEEIRLRDPFDRIGPNWTRLPTSGKIARPPASTVSLLDDLLKRRLPPGPRYIDLINEIWSRGFEVFLVGGTVRDALAGVAPQDIDLVTTMPLVRAKAFIQSMFKYDPSHMKTRGFIRIGGAPKSGDPHIDLKVFSDSLLGTAEATFGVGFDRDLAHRDFACNAIYYDPINKTLIDPSGRGISDALSRHLALVCETGDPHQYAQILIRAVKFAARGFTIEDATLNKLQGEIVDALPSMRLSVRIGYVRTQVLSKCVSDAEHGPAMEVFKAHMNQLGLGLVWDKFFDPVLGQIINDKR